MKKSNKRSNAEQVLRCCEVCSPPPSGPGRREWVRLATPGGDTIQFAADCAYFPRVEQIQLKTDFLLGGGERH
jgi:hypothetical protein